MHTQPRDTFHTTPSAAADIPLTKAVAGVRVGYLPGAGFIINPSAAQMAQSSLDLLMAGTAEAVLMIEGFCDWLTEEHMLEVGPVCLEDGGGGRQGAKVGLSQDPRVS